MVMMTRRLATPSMLQLLLLLASIGGVISQASPFGHQAQNANGLSNFGGAMAYDEQRHALLLTGQTYGSYLESQFPGGDSDSSSNCFLTMLQLKRDQEDPEFDSSNNDGGVTFASTIGKPGIRETCRSIAVFDDKAFLGGWSEPNGTLQPLWMSGNNRPPQFGTILDVDFSTSATGDGDTILRGGELIRDTTGAQSSEAMVVNEGGTYLYVANWVSEVPEEAPQSEGCLTASSDRCNYSTGGAVVRGEDYLVNVVRYAIENDGSTGVKRTLKATWQLEIQTEYQVEVSGLVLLGASTLYLAGSAKGHNKAIPQTDPTGIIEHRDYDGYITKLDASNREILEARRIESLPTRKDFVNHVCGQGDDLLFVVGTTYGTFDLTDDRNADRNDEEHERAFLMKINADTLDTDWFVELKAGGGAGGGDGDIRGLRCAITSDGLHVYVGGAVVDGSHIDKHSSKGQDDLWVAQYNTKDNDQGWVRQVGTNGNEALVDMTTDKYGNVILFANTQGSYMKNSPSEDVTDTLVLSLTRNEGMYEQAVEDTEIPPSVTEPPVMVPQTTDAPELEDSPTASPGDGGEDRPTRGAPTAVPQTPAPTSHESIGAAQNPTEGASTTRKNAITGLLFALSVCVVLIGCFVWQQRNGRDDSYNDSNAQVLDYLKGFENVEVDLKHSATGGWHGTYVNHDGAPKYMDPKRHSTNIPPSEVISFDNEMEPFVRDSLFADDDDDPTSLGSNASPTGSATRQSSSGYGGLVDAYNNTWDDLSPHNLPRSKLSGTPNGSGYNSPRHSMTHATRKSLDKIELAHGTSSMQDIHLEEENGGNEAWGREII